MTDKNLLLQDDYPYRICGPESRYAPAAPDSLEHLPSHHCAGEIVNGGIYADKISRAAIDAIIKEQTK